MALTFAAYIATPSWHRPVAVAAVLALVTVNYRLVTRTARLTRWFAAGSPTWVDSPRSPATGTARTRCSRRPACSSSPSRDTPGSRRWARKSAAPPALSPAPSSEKHRRHGRGLRGRRGHRSRGPRLRPGRRLDEPLTAAVRAGSWDCAAPVIQVGGALGALGPARRYREHQPGDGPRGRPPALAGRRPPPLPSAASRRGHVGRGHDRARAHHGPTMDLRGAIGFSSFGAASSSEETCWVRPTPGQRPVAGTVSTVVRTLAKSSRPRLRAPHWVP